MSRAIEFIFEPKQGKDFQQFLEGDRAKRMAPFVLFDTVAVKGEKPWGFGWHAHSGVATLTYIYAAQLNHADSANDPGIVKQGGFQWMQAGGGIWHKEMLDPIDGFVGAHQLWVQLPPEEEEGENGYFDVTKESIPQTANSKVLIGHYADADAGLKVPADMTYLDVTLQAGESWDFQPPESQVRGFVYPRKGNLMIDQSELPEGNMGVFYDSDKTIVINALADTEFVVVLSALPSFPLVKAYGQAHTTQDALQRSSERIKQLEKSIPDRDN